MKPIYKEETWDRKRRGVDYSFEGRSKGFGILKEFLGFLGLFRDFSDIFTPRIKT